MPGKVAYHLFEDDPGVDFDFFLADRLRMTVAELRARVDAHEWRQWLTWHGRRAQQQELAQKRAKHG